MKNQKDWEVMAKIDLLIDKTKILTIIKLIKIIFAINVDQNCQFMLLTKYKYILILDL